MRLRLGLSRMLDAAQKRREIEPAAEAALVSELSKLKKVRLPPALLTRLAVRFKIRISNLSGHHADRRPH